MTLSRIYSNDNRFSEIVFKDGINMILATGEKPHSIGKTTFLHLVDYCLLKSDLTDLLNNEKLNGFVFFLEIKKKNGLYITIKRELGSKDVYFKEHSISANLKDEIFEDCFKINEAPKILSQKLDFSVNEVQNQNFRTYLSYFMREKGDTVNVFKPNKFQGKDSDWKPFVASMMGINMEPIKEKAELDKTKKFIQNTIRVFESEFLVKNIDEKNIEQLMKEYEQQIAIIEKNCKELDLFAEDDRKQKELVQQIDNDISSLNLEKYRLQTRNRLVNQAIKKKQEINLQRIQELFKDMNIYFKESLVRSYDEVIAFNKKILKDSYFYLKKEKEKNSRRLKEINDLLKEKNNRRVQILENLTQDNILEKVMQLMQESSDLKIKLKAQKDLMDLLHKYRQKDDEFHDITSKIQKASDMIKQEISKEKNHKLKYFLDHFSKYSKNILLEDGNINVSLNNQNNIDFKIKTFDLENHENAKNKGETFSKISCLIFNICSILLAKNDNFFSFVFYDGLFDGVAIEYIDRIIKLMKDMEENGTQIQIIFTSIEKDIQDSEFFNDLKEHYLLRELADSDTKRLFAMETY